MRSTEFSRRRRWLRTAACAGVLAAGGALIVGSCRAQEYLTGIEWEKPPVVTPGTPSTKDAPGKPPSDAVVLFDGKDLSAWNGGDRWKVENGEAVVNGGMIETKQHFGDAQLHIEWSAPVPPTGESQGRGNSGVFFGPYELQVLDSYENETYYDGQAASIYKQHPPMVNAMRPPGEWNVYDVVWTAPRFKDDGSLESPAAITVIHNGVVVQNHFELLGDTPYNRPPEYTAHPAEQPIRLQDHGNPVRFRNIWIRPIKPIEGKRTRDPFLRAGDKEIPIPQAKVTGQVTIDGKPLAEGTVVLYSHGAGRAVEAKVADGKFSLEANPGRFAAAVTSDGEPRPRADFGDKDKTPISLELQAGKNELQLDVRSE
jgi:hypothetical protein